MASGHVNRTKGRTHGCTDQLAGVKKVLANSEPSTHGTKRTCRWCRAMSAFGGKADSRQMLPKCLLMTHSGPQPSRNPALQQAPSALQNGTSLLGRPPGMPVTSRGAHAGFQRATHCDKDFSTLSTERVDRAQWRHTIRIVHRHRRAFQRGRRGATLRKGRSMMGQARQCTCAEGQRTGRSIDRSEPCHGWLLMR